MFYNWLVMWSYKQEIQWGELWTRTNTVAAGSYRFKAILIAKRAMVFTLLCMDTLLAKPAFGQRLFMVLLLLIIGLWMYAPSLALPLSLVDDYLMLMNLDRWEKDIASGGVKYAIQQDFSIEQKIYNTGFWIQSVLKLKLAGEQPFHWLRLFELAVVCTMMFRIICRAAGGKNAGFYVAGLMVAIFLIAELPWAGDLQALRMNWYRLFTSDADALVYTSVFCLAIVELIHSVVRRSRLSAIAWSLLAVISGCLAFTMKLPFAAMLVGALVALAIASLICKERRVAIWTGGVALGMVGTFVIYNVVLRKLHIEKPGATYADGFTVTAGAVGAGIKAYGLLYWQLFGPLLPIIIALLPWAVITMWRDRFADKKTMLLCLVFLLALLGCSIVVYLPWSPHLPRYMLAGVFSFLLLAGVVLTLGLQALAQIGRARRGWLLVILAGAIATAFNPWVFLVICLGAAVAAIMHRAHIGVPFLVGAGAVGIAYIFAVSPAVRSTAEHVYLNREQAGWSAVQTLLKYNAQGRNVCFVGNARDEMIGSMAGHVMRFGIEPRVFESTDSANCGPGSVIMTLKWVSEGQNLPSAIAGRQVAAEFGAVDGEFPVSVSFWTARERLWQNREEPIMVDYWKSEYVWRFYE